jgi:probable HAF family extracellular repeat protein
MLHRMIALMLLMQIAPSTLAQKPKPQANQLSFNYFKITVPDVSIISAQGISNAGVIVGGFEGDAFILRDGVFSTYTPYGDCGLNGVNASGEMVGSYFPDNGGSPPQGFIVVNGVAGPLNVPNATGTIPLAISDSGTVVGQYYDIDASDASWQGFIDHDGQFLTLDFPGASETAASGVNDKGEVVGDYIESDTAYSFIYENRNFRQLVVPGCLQSGATGINNNGDVVGFCQTSKTQYGYLYKNGTFTFLAGPTGSQDTTPHGVNDADEIVGEYAPVNTFDVWYGFLAVPSESGSDLPAPK